MKHDHKKDRCIHDTQYCQECDTFECKLCGQEWVKKGYEQLTPQWTPTYPLVPQDKGTQWWCGTCQQWIGNFQVHTCNGTPNIIYCSHKQ